MPMTLNDREKAVLIFGMYRAFKAGGFPKHFNRDDKAQWKQRARWAEDILTGGAFNPMDAWRVRDLADDELISWAL